MSEKGDKRQAELRSKLQARILDASPQLEELSAEQLWRDIKSALFSAYNDGLLDTPHPKIHEYVPKPIVDGRKVMISGGLVAGKKPFKREADHALIKRSDGAWLHFTLTLECGSERKPRDKKVQALWAYDFELVFPDGHSPAFVRFDLNEPDHPNEDRELRSHMHPGNDDLLLPAPVMSPEELLDVLIRRLRNSRDDEKPRS
jgi:hypothetical protein